jgi:hypothetical protein
MYSTIRRARDRMGNGVSAHTVDQVHDVATQMKTRTRNKNSRNTYIAQIHRRFI